MMPTNPSDRPSSSILIKAGRLGIFSILAIASSTMAIAPSTEAQIAVDGSTATEVKGNVISPTGAGTVNGGNLYNSFQEFNVPTSGVIFNTGNSSVDGTKVNNIINRVTGENPSSIFGEIESRQAFPNANLFLLNPNGVVFSPNAKLNIGGSFNVSTGTGLGFDQNQKFIVDQNSLIFPSGDPKNIQFAVGQPAAIINQGSLSVSAGKNIAITAGTVINTGNLSAPNGNVDIAAVAGNSQVELRSPDLVLGLSVSPNTIPSTWNGQIATLPKLAEALTGKVDQANQVVVKADGSIALVVNPSASDIAVKDGMAIASGSINVSSESSKGGNIGIFGKQVGLVNAQVNASGATSGGTVLIGGDFQGKGTAPNALQTFISASSNIFANGLLTGDGGKVIVWADRSTQFLGAIAARGGDISGDGGFVEVSGKQNLNYQGSTDTRAPNGKTGTLLLDPQNIEVVFGSNIPAQLGANDQFSDSPAPPATSSISNVTINNAASNVVLQATNNINFNAPINIIASGVGLTAQAGNSIISDGFGNGTITTNGGDVNLIANDSTSASGSGTISIGGNITTDGGAINLRVDSPTASSNSALTIEGVALSSGAGNITLQGKNIVTGGSSDGITINGFSSINSTTGNISLNGESVNGIGINATQSANVTIASGSGSIKLTGLSTNGDGIVIAGGVPLSGNVKKIETNSGNIEIIGNAVNPARLGINIQPPSGNATVNINSGTGNLAFTSDRSEFPNVELGGTGTISLKAFSSNVALTIGGNNVFLSNSFLTSLANSSSFSNVAIGDIASNNAITGAQNLSINTLNFAPIAIQTAGAFDGNGFAINTNGSSFTLTANQDITALGSVTANGGNVSISSSLGSIGASLGSTISTLPIDPLTDSGNISITALNGNLNLQNLSTGFSGEASSKAGNITLSVAGSSSITVTNINAATLGNTTGSAGTVSFLMGDGQIGLAGNLIDLSSTSGSASSLIINNPLSLITPTSVVDGITINGLTINTSGAIGSGDITFNSAIVKSNSSDLTISSGSGNVTFTQPINPIGQLLGNLTVKSTGTVTFANTVFANSISSSFGGNTIINADLVATGADGFINLGNFTANGNISLVGNEIDLDGLASGTGDLTLKPLATTQAIAIGGNEDTGISTLNILNSDLNAFANGTFNSLTIGNLNGSGAVFLLGNANFFQPTTLQSPVGNGSFFSNGFNITGVGRLGIEVGDVIAIINANIAPSAGKTLNVRLNADRDASGAGLITLNNSSISSGGQNITLGGGLNPVVDAAIAVGNAAGVTLNSTTLDAQGGNIFVNGRNTSTFGANNNGILITRTSTTQPISRLLTSGLGTINLAGTSATVGLNNSDGISVESGSRIESANGNISLVGVGGNGTTLNDGIEIEGNALLRTTGTGSISLVGDTLSTAINNRDVNILGSIIETLGTGAISIASSPNTPRLIQVVNSSINPTANPNSGGGSGTVTLESEAIELLGSTQIKGVGQLIIQPTLSSTGIRLGGAINDANLNLSTTELATIQDGFSQILIGRLDGAGQILLADNLFFSDPITLRSQGISGSINTSGFNFTSTGAISFLANQNITTGNVTALGNNLTLSSSLGAINTSQGLLDTSNTAGNGGNISLSSPSINTNLGSINTSSMVGNAGNLSFANISSGLITIAGSEINLSSGNGVAGSLNFLAPVLISNSNLTINTSSASGTSGAVAFSNNLNGAIANANSLTVNAGAGNITFSAIGNNTALGDLTANTSGKVSLNGNITTTNASLSGDLININSNLTTSGNLTINNADTLKISTGTKLDITGEFAQVGSGSVQFGGNIVRAASVSFAKEIELIGDSSITSDGAINFGGNVDGLFALTLDASGNFIVANGGFGTIEFLQSLAIASSSKLVSQANPINIKTTGNVAVGDILNNGRDISIISEEGAIVTGDIDSSFASSNGGNVNLSAISSTVTTGNIATNSSNNAGEVNIESGVISTGNINASGGTGGKVFFKAVTAITAGQISTKGFEGAGGDVILDPSGDVVVATIDTSGLTGGNVTLVSTEGNLKITDILNNPNGLAACQGASICTIGSTSSGTISLQTGGLNPFVIGNASINGSSGFLTTGQSILAVGTSIPVLLNNTFSQNGISISPGGFIPIELKPLNPLEDLNNKFESSTNPSPDQGKVLAVRDVLINQADRYFREGNLEKAFEVIERAYVSELEGFTGKAIKSETITIENTQDLLSTVVQQTGDVAALIYPVLLNDRIEILVIPPKEKGKPFSRSSIATNLQQIEAVVTDYRNNLRDVGSNDYLEQSQQLYNWIIRPIKAQLEAMKIDTLVFAMDGGLRVTPPSALHDGKQFLIENFAIASIPSLRVTRIEERDRKATRVLAMGLTESVAGFSALPSVDIEIKTISANVLSGDAFLNQKFTVNNLQAQRQSGIYNILHLGTHAKFVSDTSKDSFIQFWDSRLSLRDIPKLRFDNPAIDMLALSACQTAVGNNLGISGLAVESGAKSVLASLWEVSDAGTAPLMISFYKAFPDAVNKAQAMRKAQIELLTGRVTVGDGQILGIDGIPSISLPSGVADIDLKHPFYWSSFILVGNWL